MSPTKLAMSPALTTAGTGSRQLKPLGAFAFHLQGDLLDVEDDVGDIFTHAGERREFVQDVLDLDRGDRRALQRGKKNATQRVAKRQAKATLQRLGNEGRLALTIAAGLDFQARWASSIPASSSC
jgi:hypothetical protein